jgi:AcrR family transcriptional regulator
MYPVAPAATRGASGVMNKRGPGPVPRFTQEELARRALEIMDAHGTGGLTMRGLAEELGMGTMALYRYFPSKNALIDAAIDLAAPEIELPAPGSAPWRDQLRDLARALFDAGRRHPRLARERFNRPLQSQGAIRITNAAVALLLEAGLRKHDAVAAFKALLIHTLGAAAIAAAETHAEVRHYASQRHASVPSEEVPAMAVVAEELTDALGGNQAFEFGLTALLDQIAKRSEP